MPIISTDEEISKKRELLEDLIRKSGWKKFRGLENEAISNLENTRSNNRLWWGVVEKKQYQTLKMGLYLA